MPSEPPNPGVRVLVLDDEAAIVTALLSTLREGGYVAAGATTAREALEKLRAQAFDILLTDLQLAEIDGVSVIRQALLIDPTLVTIVMTGHGSIDTAVEAMKAGAADYLPKPFKLRMLETVMGRALALRRLRLENESLQQSLLARSHELEAANKELQAFSYSVSHDLRAPLRTIMQYAELIEEDASANDTKALREHSQRIRRNAHQMQGLIDDLLRLGRAFETELHPQRIDLAPTCTEILEKKRQAHPERKVAWEVPSPMPVWADPGLLAIVMQNLLDNAWKYTMHQPEGNIRIAFTREEREARVAVADNGIGFDPEDGSKLFAPFSRLRNASRFEGTGIGLATVERIIRRHGGRIWAEGQLGQGSTFFFTLPRAFTAAAGTGQPVNEPISKPNPPSP